MEHNQVPIDQYVNYLEEYSREIGEQPKRIGSQYFFRCPLHGERTPSMKVIPATGQFKCHGCGASGNFFSFLTQLHGEDYKNQWYENVLRTHGLWEEPSERQERQEQPRQEQPGVDYNLTLEAYAQRKGFDIEWLQDMFCLSDGTDKMLRGDGIPRGQYSYVKFPYFGEDGTEVVFRKRYGQKQLRWGQNSQGKIIPYAAWNHEAYKEEGWVVLVEGESDCQTMLAMDFPTYGIPGSQMFGDKYMPFLEGITKIYMHQEPDTGGTGFIKHNIEVLRRNRYGGKVYVFSCSESEDVTGCKDPSDFYLKLGDKAKDAMKKLVDGAKEISLNEPEPVPELIQGAPINLRPPFGYDYSEKGVFRVDEEGNHKRIIGMPIIIKSRVHNIDTGEEKIELAYLKNGVGGREWRTSFLKRDTVFTSKGATELTNLGMMVTSENMRQFIRFMDALEAENDDIIPWIESADSFGWKSGGRFIPGNDGGIVVDGVEQYVKAVTEHGDYGAWKEFMELHRPNNTRFRFILAASFTTPLLEIFSIRSSFVYNFCKTKGGKTAMMLLALSVWGNPHDMMVTFNSTETSLERITALFNGLPILLDERQAAGDNQRGQQKVESIIYQIGENKGKSRGTIQGLQNVKTWRTIALATGERSIQEENTQGGISTRVFSIEGGALRGQKGKEAYDFLAKKHYGWAGRDFVRRLCSTPRAELKREQKQFLDYANEKATDESSSHTQFMAVVAFADALATDWIFHPELAVSNDGHLHLSDEAVRQSKKLIDDIMEIQAAEPENDNYTNATQAVLDWVTANAERAFEMDIGTNERYGWLSNDGKIAYLIPTKLYAALRQAGNYQFSQFRSEWGKKGIIRVMEVKGRNGNRTKEYTYPCPFKNGQRVVWFYFDEAKKYIDMKQARLNEGSDTDSYGTEGFVDVTEDSADELPFD